MYFSWATSLGGVFLSWLVLLLPFNDCCAVWALIHPQAKQGWGMTFSWCILETTVSKWIRQEVPLQNITFLKIHLFSSMLTQKTSRAGWQSSRRYISKFCSWFLHNHSLSVYSLKCGKWQNLSSPWYFQKGFLFFNPWLYILPVSTDCSFSADASVCFLLAAHVDSW